MIDSSALLVICCMGGNTVKGLHPLIITAQTLAPNSVNGAGWRRPYLGRYGFVM